MELAPGPKELMNTQRFYLYLNLTKPGQIAVYCPTVTSNGKGGAGKPGLSDPQHDSGTVIPDARWKRQSEEEYTMDGIELPGQAGDVLSS